MNANFTSYSILILISILLFSCDNKQTKSTEVNTKKTISTIKQIPTIKRKSDPTKIAFGDIEFGMTEQELLQTQVFIDGSTHVSTRDRITSSYIMNKKMEDCKLDERIIIENKIIKEDDVKYLSCTNKIGIDKYKLTAYLFRNSLFLIKITGGELSNLISVISKKYHNPESFKGKKIILFKEIQERNKRFRIQECNNRKRGKWTGIPQEDLPIPVKDCEIIPEPYCKYEWRLNNKIIQVFNIYTENSNGTEKTIGYDYVVEIYNNEMLDNYLVNFKNLLKNNAKIITEQENKLRVKDSGKF